MTARKSLPSDSQNANPLLLFAWANRLFRPLVRHELWLLAIAAPFLLFPNRYTPAAFLLILLTWIGRWLVTGRFTIQTPLDYPIAIILIMALVGYTVSVDPLMSRAKLWGIVLQAALFYGVVNGLTGERAILRLAYLLLVGTGLLALLSLVGTDWDNVRLLDLPWLYHRLPRLISGLPGSGLPQTSDMFSPREVGATMAMLLPLAVVFLFWGSHRWQRALAAAALILAGIVLLLSQALMGYFGLALALLLIAVYWQPKLLWLLLAGLLLLGGTLLLKARPLAALVLDPGHTLGIGFVLRFDIWSRALAMIRDMPITGIGLNTFPLVQTHFYIGHLLGPEVHAHNLFLQTAIDLGLPGLLAFLASLLALLLVAIRAYRAAPGRQLQLLLVGLAAGILAYLSGGLLDTMTLGAKPVAALWLMFGLLVAIANLSEQSHLSPRRQPLSSHRWLFALPALALLIALLALPAIRRRNLSLVFAQQAILTARTSGVLPLESAQAAISRLNQAIDSDPSNPELYGALGTLYAWQGTEEAALEALRQRVDLDGHDPLGRYAPFIKWRLRLANDPIPAPDAALLQIYTPWRTRFPDRAEPVVLTALLLQDHLGNPAAAAGLAQSALDRHARPYGLLSAYLRQLETGE